MIQYTFDEEKATQVAAEFLSRAPKHVLNDVVLMKLMYFAERRSLELYDQPIIGDTLYCMFNGPVLSEVLDLYKASHGTVTEYSSVDCQKSVFVQHIKRNYGTVSLIRQPQIRKLSRAEKRILDDVFIKYGNMTQKEIVKAAHDLCEYIETSSGRKLLPYENILKSLGHSEEEIKQSEHRALTIFSIKNNVKAAKKNVTGQKDRGDCLT